MFFKIGTLKILAEPLKNVILSEVPEFIYSLMNSNCNIAFHFYDAYRENV